MENSRKYYEAITLFPFIKRKNLKSIAENTIRPRHVFREFYISYDGTTLIVFFEEFIDLLKKLLCYFLSDQSDNINKRHVFNSDELL